MGIAQLGLGGIGFSVSRLLQECRHDYHDNCIIYYDHNCDDISLLQNFVHHTKSCL